MPRHSFTTGAAGLACAAALVLSAGTTFASVSHFSSALVRPGDAPPDFSQSHLKVYKRFTTLMQVTTRMRSISTKSVCTLPQSFAQLGWKQGLIEAFDRSVPTYALQVCASLFRDTAGAHAAYRDLVKSIFTARVQVKMASRLSMPAVGDESSAITHSEKQCVCDPKPTLFSYEVVFRHANALVDLAYSGPASRPGQFEQLARRVNSRLH